MSKVMIKDSNEILLEEAKKRERAQRAQRQRGKSNNKMSNDVLIEAAKKKMTKVEDKMKKISITMITVKMIWG